VDDGLTVVEKVFGIGSALTVGLPAIFVHYRSAYRSARFEPLPFAAHLLNWTGMALCLVLYSSGQRGQVC
jgi:hypothetical protein